MKHLHLRIFVKGPGCNCWQAPDYTPHPYSYAHLPICRGVWSCLQVRPAYKMAGNAATIQVNAFAIIRSPYQLRAVPIGIVLVGVSLDTIFEIGTPRFSNLSNAKIHSPISSDEYRLRRKFTAIFKLLPLSYSSQ